jgi:hypothetical protein
MIRTKSVTLTTLPAAIAYRLKGTSGGSSLVIVRADEPQPGIATISKTSGEPIIATNTPAAAYPIEAFREALELTSGLPYRRQGKPAAPGLVPTATEEPAVEDEQTDEATEVVVASDEYQSVLDAYITKDGKFSYDLMNKEMIQFAHKSEMVGRMIGAGEEEDAILAYIIGTKFRNITGNKDLADEQVSLIAALIDEISPKGAFKELKAKVRSMLGEAKRA